ncbi:unnamed protein product, partial [Plutella xylostella]
NLDKNNYLRLFAIRKKKKNIRSQAREVIYRIYIQCLAEHEAGHILSNLEDIYARTASMTGVSDSTVRHIAKECSIMEYFSWKKQNRLSKKRN